MAQPPKGPDPFDAFTDAACARRHPMPQQEQDRAKRCLTDRHFRAGVTQRQREREETRHFEGRKAHVDVDRESPGVPDRVSPQLASARSGPASPKKTACSKSGRCRAQSSVTLWSTTISVIKITAMLHLPNETAVKAASAGDGSACTDCEVTTQRDSGDSCQRSGA